MLCQQAVSGISTDSKWTVMFGALGLLFGFVLVVGFEHLLQRFLPPPSIIIKDF